MRPSNNRAFKEWAVVCRALAEGRQTLILRKGGIAEAHGAFELTDKEFFLFPTYLHQSPDGVIPEWREGITDDPAPGRVMISHYAAVASGQRVESLEVLRALRPYHITSDAVVEERYRRWSPGGVYALMVRVQSLAAPVVLESLESYAGCTSWLTLAREIPLAGARPALDDAAFKRRLADMKGIACPGS
ncbi:MAG: DUF1802 family protein [Planctomycetes bacterium]|nr:DUF1802 family protein [Planctomycetota bacterium]